MGIPIKIKCKKKPRKEIWRDFEGTVRNLEEFCPECGGNIGPCMVVILDCAIKKGD